MMPETLTMLVLTQHFAQILDDNSQLDTFQLSRLRTLLRKTICTSCLLGRLIDINENKTNIKNANDQNFTL